MTSQRLVTVVGATGAQGGAVLRALVETKKYKIRALTRNPTSDKAQALKHLGGDIEIVKCDITNMDDVQRAFKDSWAVFAVTDSFSKPGDSEDEMKQGTTMADAAALLRISYYIFSMSEEIDEKLRGKLKVPHISQKSKICDYIKKKYPDLKTIYVAPEYYMQNWKSYAKVFKLDDGTVVFPLPCTQKAKLPLVDINDLGSVARVVLESPEKFVGRVVYVCGQEISFEDVSKTFTKVTGIPAISKTLTREEFCASLSFLSQNMLNELLDMYQLYEIPDSYGNYALRINAQKLAKLNTFEEWLKKTGWKGD